MNNFLPLSCFLLVKVWFHSHYAWGVLSDVSTGDKRACRDLSGSDLSPGAMETPITVNMMEAMLKLGVCTLKNRFAFQPSGPTRLRWSHLYNEFTAGDVPGLEARQAAEAWATGETEHI